MTATELLDPLAAQLHPLLGHSRPPAQLHAALGALVDTWTPAAVGALHLTCADEAERGCAEAFQREFAGERLPPMRHHAPAALRLANLGARYEPGAYAIAEDHFTTAAKAGGWTLLVAKLNAHVGRLPWAGGARYGALPRHGATSAYCGALTATLEDAQTAFAQELREAFHFGGVDRLAVLQDPTQVEPRHRQLCAAVLNARLQARRCMLDVQEHAHPRPTLTLVLACVSLNQPDDDAELLCGVYAADRRGDPGGVRDVYCGLGDEPGLYRVLEGPRGLQVDDPELGRPRPARDHRDEVLRAWRGWGEAGLESWRALLSTPQDDEAPLPAAARFEALVERMNDEAPVAGAVLLFAAGLGSIGDLTAVQRLAAAEAWDEEHDDPPDPRELLRAMREEFLTADVERRAVLLNAIGARLAPS